MIMSFNQTNQTGDTDESNLSNFQLDGTLRPVIIKVKVLTPNQVFIFQTLLLITNESPWFESTYI